MGLPLSGGVFLWLIFCTEGAKQRSHLAQNHSISGNRRTRVLESSPSSVCEPNGGVPRHVTFVGGRAHSGISGSFVGPRVPGRSKLARIAPVLPLVLRGFARVLHGNRAAKAPRPRDRLDLL